MPIRQCVLFAFLLGPLCHTTTLRAEITGTTLVGSSPLTSPRTVFATHAPGRPNELFVLDQSGLVQILDLTTGAFSPQPFLDIRSQVISGGERGLLGLAFHPDFVTNGQFYVNYTNDSSGALMTRVDRYQASDPLTATFVSTRSRSQVLDFSQDFSNHNGGWIGFSPNDGYLYIATGDGGSANDPNNNAQDLGTRLGKMLRIDVNGDDFPTDPEENFAVPPDNPFIDGNPSTLDEIWAYGLRNPWRASFDRDTGDLWIGDVGQNAREEIDYQAAGFAGGANYGWRLREGDTQTPDVGGPIPADYVPPIYDYPSNGSFPFGGNSVVGGYVYRGPDPEVRGRYFFGDYSPSRLWTFEPSDPDGTVTHVSPLLNPAANINVPVSYAEDAFGNLYIVNLGGQIYRIKTDALAPGDYNADGLITIADYQKWRDDFGLTESTADGNGDGAVDVADYTIWRDAYGEANPGGASAPTPEPQTLVIAGVLLAAMGGLARHPA